MGYKYPNHHNLYRICVHHLQWILCHFSTRKCDFLKDRPKYVENRLLLHSNWPAKSKLNFITVCPTPTIGQKLHFFLGLIRFYHNYSPRLVSRTNPLHEIQLFFFWSSILPFSWTPNLLKLFTDYKIGLIFSIILSCIDLYKPNILKQNLLQEACIILSSVPLATLNP